MGIWYRVAKLEKIEQVFSGEGGLFTAGRWNYKGRKVVYCSQSISLCTLEWLSHNGLSVSGFVYYKFAIEIPNELVLKTEKENLPKNWNITPAADVTREFAENHLFKLDRYLGIEVPSVMVPEENNLVVNPLHHAFSLQAIVVLGKYKAPSRHAFD